MKKREGIPPKFFHRFFRWFCHPKLRTYIEGDLMELYDERLKESGKRKADLKFIIDVLLLFRPGIIRPARTHMKLNTYGMYKSYVKVGWRNLVRQKGYSLISIGGLTLGMAVAMLIGLWIHDELQFNKYHRNYKKIAQVMRNGTLTGETSTHTYQPYALADELKTKYRHLFEHVVRVWPAGGHVVSGKENKFALKGTFMDAAGPEMFTLRMLNGTWSGLEDPGSILLSESAAKALFGNDDPIDKHVRLDTRMDAKVTGVYEDLPYNSHFHGLQFIAPWDLLESNNEWITTLGFKSNSLHIYTSIAGNTSFEEVTSQVKDAILNNVRDDKQYVAINPQIFLHPMEAWHLRSEWKNGMSSGGRIETVWLFGIVGLFVLLLACINFMNLATARSERRAKEVGIRKTIGSVRTQLVSQFFAESFLVVVLAFVFALVLMNVALTWFNDLSGKEMSMPWTNFFFWIVSTAFIFVTGLLAGSYPALYLSSFSPIRVLKGTLHVGRLASAPRKVLVIVQFTVSVVLIIGTIGIYEQVQFAKRRPVGYSRDGLLMIQMLSPDFYGKFNTLQTELKRTNTVLEIAESSSPTTDVWNSNGGFKWEGKDPAFKPEFATMTVSPQYGRTVGWEFVKGRDFSERIASDSAAFVINEAAARQWDFDDPIGKTITWNSVYRSKYTNFTVIGVIRDMVMKSPYSPTMPAIYFLGSDKNWINIRINPDVSTSVALKEIEGAFSKVVPSVPFDYRFADEEYASKFAAEERIGKLVSVFALLAVLISCLGLYGLAAFVAERRTKEIGIRKVVGASAIRLWQMLSKDFVVLILISCLVAVPLAWYFLDGWLQKFEYRTSLSWWTIALTCFGAVLVTLLTVSYQALKVAAMNPVKCLRSE